MRDLHRIPAGAIRDELARRTRVALAAEGRRVVAPSDSNSVKRRASIDVGDVPTRTLMTELRGRRLRIVGADDRIDLTVGWRDHAAWGSGAFGDFNIRRPHADRIEANARALALVLPISAIERAGAAWRLREPRTFSERVEAHRDYGHPLCAGERFRDEPSAGIGTAWLASDRRVVTAGHLLETAAADEMCFVFGWRNGAGGAAPFDGATIPASAVYTASALIAADADPAKLGDDFAIIELDRSVPSAIAEPLRLAPTRPDVDDVIYVMGFPCGLPLKYAGDAVVLPSNAAPRFVTTLDTFAGNSGSPVFSAETDEVIGLFLAGGDDFDLLNGSYDSSSRCFVSTRIDAEDSIEEALFVDRFRELL